MREQPELIDEKYVNKKMMTRDERRGIYSYDIYNLEKKEKELLTKYPDM